MTFGLTLLSTGLTALCLGAGCTYLILHLSERVPWLSRASSDRLHVAATPIWGGVGIFAAFFGVMAWRGLFSTSEPAILACACGIFLLGFVDDIWNLRPRWKLLGQTICALAPVSYVVGHPLSGNGAIDVIVVFLWLVGITNAFNLLDNINGLSAGTAVLISGLQALFFLEQGEITRALASVAFCGAILGFLVFNFPSGRIFMGDSGSLFIGFWLAASTLTGTQFGGKNHYGTFLFPLLLMAVPICDTTLVTLTRMLRGRPISQGGTDHVSHRLLAYGFSPTAAVLALWGFTLFTGALGYFAVSYEVPPILSVVPFLISAVVLFGTYLTRFELHPHHTTASPTLSRPRVAGWVRIAFRVGFDLLLILAVYYSAYLLRFDGSASRADMEIFRSTVLELALIKLAVFMAFGVYRPWWEYFGLRDAYRLIAASTLASLTAVAYFLTIYRFAGFSRVVFALDFLVFTMLVLIFRFSFRFLDEVAPANHRTNVFIYGADGEGETAMKFVSKHHRFRVVGFLDDDRAKRDFSIHSVPIRGGTQDLAQLADRWQARAVLLTPSTSGEVQNKLVKLCNVSGIQLMRLHLRLEELGIVTSASPAQDSASTGATPAKVKVFSKASSN